MNSISEEGDEELIIVPNDLLGFLRGSLAEIEEMAGDIDIEARIKLQELETALFNQAEIARVKGETAQIDEQIKSIEAQMDEVERNLTDADEETMVMLLQMLSVTGGGSVEKLEGIVKEIDEIKIESVNDIASKTNVNPLSDDNDDGKGCNDPLITNDNEEVVVDQLESKDDYGKEAELN
mmetsp:Transcript_1497/g.2146  ORF Transcript_1497/g.2146 Transcript_1497/m.2146 type:complete len:180 (-) Transcript_1497:247-786(-)|eukprot:CAMPEP_0175059846 /NCGR_PEP_ID=MMETSP0052_2-20121109/12660_1 /TAXON_ID=51329 ORGANISM="Polytomella parva, Strain SAG 63-3" /NCGR_SAMPLE_ID=MMETSP0052_2 /ASSEMBLY_ACC=CAM_ASM_000194 /LENGTH=179 /DNA_ID=CAMNT_0016325443 /DNA_START=35 /DNA_END=574 /DNA_ORIENTATION=-